MKKIVIALLFITLGAGLSIPFFTNAAIVIKRNVLFGYSILGFINQKWQTIDDWVCYGQTSCAGKTEYTGEEASWANVAGSPFDAGFSTSSAPLAYDPYGESGVNIYLMSGRVRRDLRTGLWWSDIAVTVPVATATATSTNNVFAIPGSTGAGVGDGTRPTGGTAINFCEALNDISFAGHSDWYLPTQKQLMQAYIDGSANNLPNPGYAFWSSTEYYNNTAHAWYVHLNFGPTYYASKTSSYYVRCVR